MLYDLLFFKVNGALVAENIEGDHSTESDIAQVKTIPQGFSGITPGVPVVVIKLKSAVPVRGIEFDFATMMVNSQAFECQVALGGSGQMCTIPVAYVIGPVSMSSAVGKATEQDVTIVGAAPNPVWV